MFPIDITTFEGNWHVIVVQWGALFNEQVLLEKEGNEPLRLIN